MARITSSEFRLFSSQLNFVRETGQMKQISDVILPSLGIDPSAESIPVALRWSTHPSFGFGRTPFKVWRRPKKYSSERMIGQTRQINGSLLIEAADGEMYHVNMMINVAPGESVKVQALDKNSQAIPHAKIEVSSSGNYIIQSTFMKYFHFTGRGEVSAMSGVLHSWLINQPDWRLIQHVGFPFRPNTIGPPHYDPNPQGWIGAPPMQPFTAGLMRLLLGKSLFEQIPSLPSGLPEPVWKAPEPPAYLFELEGSLMKLLMECLMNTQDDSSNAANRQQSYISSQTVQGLHQPGFPGAVRPANINIPVVSTTLLSASTDNFASLGLGYGTYDIPGNSQSATMVDGGYDYMVTNVYNVRPIDLSFDFSVPVEFAALAEFISRPVTPLIENVQGQTKNRPLTRDAGTTETVTLSFKAPDFPQGYAVIKSDPDANIEVINEPMLQNPESYNPHVPNIPHFENAGEEQCFITDPESPIPLDAPQINRYFLAALDIFGRWSGYSQRSYTARPLPSQRPGLTSLRLKHVEPLPGGSTPSSTIPCTMEIECTWDWTERTPGVIQIGGGFYPADQEAGIPVFTDRFAHESANGILPLINITFGSDGTPTVSGADHDVVEVQSNDPAADPNIRKYKVLIENVSATFPGPLLHPQPAPALNPSRVAFAAVARAQEAIRSPSVWSDWVAPVVDKLDDPRPPILTPFSAQINWTALPDASNTARGKLEWTAADRAAGYVVWEASESALREFLGLTQRPDDTYQDRATELLSALSDPANERDSLKAFIRLNRDLIKDTSYEVSLPGASEVLFVYRVSAISVSNVESSRTNATFFAVPKQKIPGQPRLKLEKHRNGSPGIEVVALPGAGASPVGYKVFRVRKKISSNLVQMKGLPVYLEDNTTWVPFSMQHLDGTTSEGMKILDPVTTPSWKPYYYQVVAVGEENISQGLLRGESAGSSTETIYYPPEQPVILLTGQQLTTATHYLSVETNIPFERLEIGKAIIEIMSYHPSAPGEIPKREMLFTGPAHTLEETTASYSPGNPPLPDLSGGPEIVVHKETRTVYIRLAPDIRKGIIRVIDPLGKSEETMFNEP